MPENILNLSEGIQKSLLNQVTATENDVIVGKSFIGSNGDLKIGAVPDRGQYQYSNRIYVVGDYIAFEDIPEGIYRKNGAVWAPEIRADLETVKNLVGSTSKRVRVVATTYLGTRGSTPFGHCDIYIYNADTGEQIGGFSGDSTAMNGPGSNSETTCSL